MKKFFLLMAVFGLIVVMTSCQKPEEVTLTKYFQAMGHNDNDTMASMALEPKDIEYKSYKIVSVSEPEKLDYELPILIEKEKEITGNMRTKAREATDKRDEMLDLEDELEITRSSRRRSQLKTEIEGAEAAFKETEAEYKDLVRARDDMRKKIDMAKSLVNLSASIDSRPEVYKGHKEATRADVKVTLPDGTEKDYVFLLVRYKFVVDERELPSRMVIEKIQTLEDYNADQAEATEEKEMATEEVTEEQPVEEQKDEGAEATEGPK
jgi:hypothetical protein